MNKKLKKALRPLRIKMSVEAVINYTLFGVIIGIAFSFCVVAAAKFVFIPMLFPVIICGVCVCAGLSVCYVLLRGLPRDYAVAEVADALGFKQRFVTAFEIINGTIKIKEHTIKELVINDAISHAEKADFRKLYKIKAPKKILFILILTLAATLTLGFIPGPNNESFKESALFRDRLIAEAEKIAEVASREAEQLTKKEAEELQAAVKELTDLLKKSKTEADAIRNIQKAQEELKRLSNNSVSKDLRALGDRLAAYENTRGLGESLQRADTEAIKQNLDALSESLKNGSEDEIKKLAESLNGLSDAITENPELAGLLDSLSEAAESGVLGDLDSKLSEIESSLSEAASKSESLRKAINNLNSALSQSGKGISGKKGDSGDIQPGSSNGSAKSDGENPAGTAGLTGEENGNGNSGEPNSNGTENGAGGTQSGTAPGGSGRGTGHIENESIYSRDAAALGDINIEIDGESTDAGSTTTTLKPGFGTSGGQVPYTEAFGAYRDEALRSLDDNEIPFGLREIVKEYFSSLE